MKKSILLISVILILVSSISFALSDKEIQDYAYKNYLVIEQENITISSVTMAYVRWSGLYTPNRIQVNKFYITSQQMLDWLIKHELKHHRCWKEYKNIDVNHKICF